MTAPCASGWPAPWKRAASPWPRPKSVAEGKARAKEAPPAYAVVDLKLDDGNGLDVVETLHTIRPESRVVVLTGFGNIATAVAAVKYGAIDYLPKPADADDILAALLATPGSKPKPPENPMSADRVRWEHIQRVYELCGHNVSRDGAPAEHASPHAAADSGQALARASHRHILSCPRKQE